MRMPLQSPGWPPWHQTAFLLEDCEVSALLYLMTASACNLIVSRRFNWPVNAFCGACDDFLLREVSTDSRPRE